MLGFKLEKPILDATYKRFLDLADQIKEVNDKDLVKLKS
jgi:2-isopropylmalate synthase